MISISKFTKHKKLSLAVILLLFITIVIIKSINSSTINNVSEEVQTYIVPKETETIILGKIEPINYRIYKYSISDNDKLEFLVDSNFYVNEGDLLLKVHKKDITNSIAEIESEINSAVYTRKELQNDQNLF